MLDEVSSCWKDGAAVVRRVEASRKEGEKVDSSSGKDGEVQLTFYGNVQKRVYLLWSRFPKKRLGFEIK